MLGSKTQLQNLHFGAFADKKSFFLLIEAMSPIQNFDQFDAFGSKKNDDTVGILASFLIQSDHKQIFDATDDNDDDDATDDNDDNDDNDATDDNDDENFGDFFDLDIVLFLLRACHSSL